MSKGLEVYATGIFSYYLSLNPMDLCGLKLEFPLEGFKFMLNFKN